MNVEHSRTRLSGFPSLRIALVGIECTALYQPSRGLHSRPALPGKTYFEFAQLSKRLPLYLTNGARLRHIVSPRYMRRQLLAGQWGKNFMHKIVDRIETAVQLGFRLKYAVENNIEASCKADASESAE